MSLVKVLMTFSTIGFFPCCTDVNRMLELESFSYVSILHHSLFSLANNRMTEITIPCYYASILRFKSIVVTPETAIRFKVSDMFRIKIIGYFHSREGVLAECFLN